MHTGPMSEAEGDLSKEYATNASCRRCKQKLVVVQTWSSHDGAYEDSKYTCQACQFVWWIEGPDA